MDRFRNCYASTGTTFSMIRLSPMYLERLFARVPGTSRVLGVIHQSEAGGLLIFMPPAYFFANDEDDDAELLPEAEEYQADLLAAIEQLGIRSEPDRPAWADDYTTQEQQHLRDEVIKQQARIENARSKLARLQQRKELGELRNQ